MWLCSFSVQPTERYIEASGSLHLLYLIELIFLSLPAPEEAIRRVAERVKQGGHDVPADVIRRRFAAGMRNFLQSYRHCADDWMLFDNSGPAPRLVEEGHNA